MSRRSTAPCWQACAAALVAAACASSPQPKPTADPPAQGAEVPAASPSQPTASANSARAVQDPSAREALRRALELAHRGDFSSAERELKQLVTRYPTLDYAWTDLGVVYEREALPGEAERAYRKALELNPDQEEAWSNLARLYCRTHRAAQIENELRARIQHSPQSIGVCTALIFTLVQEEKYETAASEAKKVLKSDERNVRALQLLAHVYYREGKQELAKMVLENTRAIDQSDPATYNALGLVNLALKSRATAMENFKQAVSLKPDFAEAKNNLGAMLNEAQDYDGAAKELEAAVNAAPDFAEARLNLGNAYRGKQELSKALSQYQQVLRIRPDLSDTYYNLAILHLDSELPNIGAVDRLKAAIAYFDQYHQKGGKDERVEQYLKDANKGIEKEQRRLEREKKEQLKKAEKPAEIGTAEVKPARVNGKKSNALLPRKPKGSAVVPANTPPSKTSQADPARKDATSGKLGDQEKGGRTEQ
jgi:tetratricopeptide (TPR) repeat protein